MQALKPSVQVEHLAPNYLLDLNEIFCGRLWNSVTVERCTDEFTSEFASVLWLFSHELFCPRLCFSVHFITQHSQGFFLLKRLNFVNTFRRVDSQFFLPPLGDKKILKELHFRSDLLAPEATALTTTIDYESLGTLTFGLYFWLQDSVGGLCKRKQKVVGLRPHSGKSA